MNLFKIFSKSAICFFQTTQGVNRKWTGEQRDCHLATIGYDVTTRCRLALRSGQGVLPRVQSTCHHIRRVQVPVPYRMWISSVTLHDTDQSIRFVSAHARSSRSDVILPLRWRRDRRFEFRETSDVGDVTLAGSCGARRGDGRSRDVNKIMRREESADDCIKKVMIKFSPFLV